jgi:glycine cleavage system H lipoate-binding protein
MTILFVLLTFLVIMTINYYTKGYHHQRPATSRMPLFVNPPSPKVATDYGFEIPQGYCFHPGHTWLLDEGRQNARVGMDSFAANLFGKIDRIEVMGLNRWVRQGQKLWSVTRDGITADMVSPIEGVVIAVNPEVQRDPNLLTNDPYKNGWVCVVKSPDMITNVKNLIRGPFIGAWMQNTLRRVGAMASQLAPATAQDGGVPIAGLLAQVDADLQRTLIREFFLT